MPPRPINADNVAMGKVIVFASPVFFALIALEWWWARRTGRTVFGLTDAIASLSAGVVSQITGVFTRLVRVGIYASLLSMVWPPESASRQSLAEFWTSPLGWVLALVFYDFCYYWWHRLSHTTAVLWAAHVVHHSSPRYNLTTALRQSATTSLLAWLFYLPMALAGVPLRVFAVVALIDLLYQFWVHTELVGKLGWFDRWFCAPSNHRVHHAVNDVYLDKNFGGIWMVWDRLFGSYAEERDTDPCVYGTRKPLSDLSPLAVNLEVYCHLWHISLACSNWADKFKLWLMPPGWQPPSAPPLPAFDMAAAKAHPDSLPKLPTQRKVWALVALFALWLQVSTSVLFFWGTWAASATAVGALVCSAALCVLAGFAQGRMGLGQALILHAAMLSCLAALYRALHVPWGQMLSILV